jgi:hypothetical protein
MGCILTNKEGLLMEDEYSSLSPQTRSAIELLLSTR